MLIPSSPCKIHGLRPGGKDAIDRWWQLALRYAFRAWQHLIDSPAGIFLVTKCLRTRRYAQALSKGGQGQNTQLHIHGTVHPCPAGAALNLPFAGTNWSLARNDLGFEIQDSGGMAEFTIFIERNASRMYRLSDVGLRDGAQRLWTSYPRKFFTDCRMCTSAGPPAPTPIPPLNPWVVASHPTPPINVPLPPPPPPPPPGPPPGTPAAATIFDGQDRLTLRQGWSLLRSPEGAFFMEQTISSSLELWGLNQLSNAPLFSEQD